jgi:pyruvate dehydrogenase E2 component (dihydrolipoamide acetyltransferase)
LTAPRRASYDATVVPAPFTSKYVDLNGTVLHYLHTGPTTFPDVAPALDQGALFLLVHGGGRNAGDFRRQLTGLGSEHSVVALDLPAHGRSPGVHGCESIEAYADLVGAFADAVLPRRAVLVGWSMGYSIALALAARQPERFAGLVLVSGQPYFDPAPGVLDRVYDVVRGRLPQQFDTILFSPSTSMDVMRDAWMEQVKTDPRVFYGDLVAGTKFDCRSMLGSVRLPTLVLHGADDKLVTCATAEGVAKAIPGARLETIEAAGHIPHLEQADRVNELLASFAGGLA